MKKETKAKLRYLRMSPRKVRLLIDLIRGMKIKEAVSQLELSTKDASLPVLKLLNSAIANAKHNDSLKEETLMIKSVFVDGGPILYRWKPRAQGRATPIRKRTSHITIILEGDVDEKVAAKVKAASAKVVTEKEVAKEVEKAKKTDEVKKVDDTKKKETKVKKEDKKEK